MIKAAFFDIDGTLVSFKTHRMPALTRRALAELHRRGIKCAITTGRSDHKLPVEVAEPFDGFQGFDAFLTFTATTTSRAASHRRYSRAARTRTSPLRRATCARRSERTSIR